MEGLLLRMAGLGATIAGASEGVRAPAREAPVPVASTLLGSGVFPIRDPLSLHMVAMHGTRHGNEAIAGADLPIPAGARFERMDGGAGAAPGSGLLEDSGAGVLGGK